MMLHRHFEGNGNDKLTRLSDVSINNPDEVLYSKPMNNQDEDKPKRGRPPKEKDDAE